MPSPREASDCIEITQTLMRYALAIDGKDYDQLGTVFTPDAEIDYAVARGTELRYPEMVEWLREALQIFRVTQHVITNPVIELDGDRARSTTYLTATHEQVKLNGDSVLVVLGGIYRDRLRRTDAGWRIEKRTLTSVYVTGQFLPPQEVQRFEKPPAP